MEAKPVTETKRNFSGLEICRVSCALAVITWHYQHFFYRGVIPNPVPSIDRSHFPFYDVLFYFYTHGGFAVPIFWVISGFIFFWKYGESIHNRKTSFPAFFMLRFSRLYPLHFATLIIVACLQILYMRTHGTSFIYGDNDIAHFLLQLCFASNWLNAEPWTFNGPIWSVSVEVLVYMGFFGVMFLFPPRILLCAVAIIAAKLLMHFNLQQSLSHCILYFFTGGVLRQLDHHVNPRHYKAVCGFSAAVAGLVFILLRLHYLHAGQTIEWILATAIVNTFILADQVVQYIARFAWVGNLTYSSYLIHFPLQLIFVLVLDALHVPRSVFLSPLMLLLFLSSTFGLAAIVYSAYEVRMQGLIRGRWFSLHKRPILAGTVEP